MKTGELSLKASAIKDSRGRPTVLAVASLGEFITQGDVPAGASKGEDEACTVSVDRAISNIEGTIQDCLHELNVDLSTHEGLCAAEEKIASLAGENYVTLGANAVLPVSRALWRMAAKLQGLELYKYIQNNEKGLAQSTKTHFLMNIFNGGLHAMKSDDEKLGIDRIDIQEIMVVPVRFESYAQAMEMGEKIDAALKSALISSYGEAQVSRGDEAGFTVKGLGDSSTAIQHVFDAISAAGYEPGEDIKLALDVAASSFYDTQKGVYHFRGEDLSSEQMIDYLFDFCDRYEGKVVSIEDGLAENDWEAWTKLTKGLNQRGVLTIGDDLFVTQLPRLRRGIEAKAADAILVKVNQNGSMAGTLDVMREARKAGMKCVISHRSGETLDDSIADIAYATGAFGLKTGDPQPPVDYPDSSTWVRRAKYLRMRAIEKLDGA